MENEKELAKERVEEPSLPKIKEMAPVISTKEWLIMLLILMLPIVNIIMLIIWALDEEANTNKSNFAKAHLIWMAIGLILSSLFFVLTFGLFMAMFN